jgi:aminomethyltransferase
MTSAEPSIPAPAPTERFSPLHQAHVDAGASFTDFAGWQMPVRYSSDLAEHHAVRHEAGLFDLSHMAEILVEGPDAAAYLDYALAGKLSVIELGRAKYSLLLAESGGIIDDLVVYRRGDEQFLIVANAGNRYAAVEALTTRATAFDVRVVDESDDYALIAVQGPRALAILEATTEIAELGTELRFMKYYRATDAAFRAAPLLVARTGYTGEDGFELYIAPDHALELWDALTRAGSDKGLVPAGLASRDTLRLEAGMPLYGHELTITTLAAQAGLGRVVNLDKENDFVGRAASEVGPASGAPVLVGLMSAGKRAGRAGYEIFRSLDTDTSDGSITSGALSPTLGYPIAMAYVTPDLARLGTEVYVDVRGTRIPATVTSLPFYKRIK